MQVGVCQESHGESIQRNLSWAGYERALPPELIPHNLFDRIFGTKEQSWIDRKQSVLDAVRDDFRDREFALWARQISRGSTSTWRPCAIWSDPSPACRRIMPRLQEPEIGGDMKDYPRIAKIQSRSAGSCAGLAADQCRQLHADQVPKPGRGCRGSDTRRCGTTTTRTPTRIRPERSGSCAISASGTSRSSRICLAKLKSIPEGDGTLLDHCCLLYVHEHAEANPHKNNGLVAIVAGHTKKLVTGTHTKVQGTLGDLYLAIANDVMGVGLESFPTASRRLEGLRAQWDRAKRGLT